MLAVVGAHRGPRLQVGVLGSEETPASALDALLQAGAIDEAQHAAGLAYAALRLRFEAAARSARRGGDGLALHKSAWLDLKARHAALIEAAGFDRFLLDRVVLDGEAPMRCEVGRVGEALGRVGETATHTRKKKTPDTGVLGLLR